MTTVSLDYFEEILTSFRGCFSRRAAWGWFAVLVLGFMLRSDKMGITSVVREFALSPGSYESLIHFFRSAAWSLHEIRTNWWKCVRDLAPLYKTKDGRIVLIGDGVKQEKEGRRMPGVTKLHQESADSSKPDHFDGHMFGGVAALAGSPGRLAAIPLSIRLHDGLRKASKWTCGTAIPTDSHVVQMIADACDAAAVFMSSTVLLLDRYFLSVPALQKLNACNADGTVRVDIVTRAKKNCVAYREPGPRKPGPGRPAKKGAPVRLQEQFVESKADFEKSTIEIYGQKKTVRWLCVDLLWGQKLYQKLRFVLIEMDDHKGIFASTDLTLDPMEIVQLYSRRFTIECCFRELKQQIGAFCYRFWSKYLPRLSHFRKTSDPMPLEQVTDEHERRKVLDAARAVEMHLMIACIAMGILQILSVRLAEQQVDPAVLRYQRTPPRGRISEGALMDWLRRNIFRLLLSRPESPITRLILGAQAKPLNDKAV